jgi:hypothetical protein
MVIAELPTLEIASEAYEEILHYDPYNQLRPEVVSKTRPIVQILGKILVDFDYS